MEKKGAKKKKIDEFACFHPNIKRISIKREQIEKNSDISPPFLVTIEENSSIQRVIARSKEAASKCSAKRSNSRIERKQTETYCIVVRNINAIKH